MVNHVKTLLLNLSNAEVKGVPGEFYIDESFSSLDVKGRLRTAVDMLFSGCSSIEDRLGRVNGLYKLLNRVDLVDRLSVYGRCDSEPTASEAYDSLSILSNFYSNVRGDSFFSPTGYTDLDSELESLKKLAVDSVDWVMCCCARILALVAQLESIRRKRDG